MTFHQIHAFSAKHVKVQLYKRRFPNILLRTIKNGFLTLSFKEMKIHSGQIHTKAIGAKMESYLKGACWASCETW